MNKLRCTRKGFTFIEIMLVAAILSVIGLVLGSVLVNGMTIWDRVNETSSDEDIGIFFDRLASDLKNAISYEGINFSGKDISFTVPGFVFMGKYGSCPGSVTYSFDEDALTLAREERTCSQIYEDKSPKEKVMVRDVISVKFTYCVYEENTKTYVWMDESPRVLPVAVKTEIKLKRKDGPYKYVETIDVPLAKIEPEEKSSA